MRFAFCFISVALCGVLGMATPADAQMAGAMPSYLPAQRGMPPAGQMAPPPFTPMVRQAPQPVPPPVMMQPAVQQPVMQVPAPVMMQVAAPQAAPPPALPTKAPHLPQYEQQVTAQKIWQKQVAEGKIAAAPPASPVQMAQQPASIPGDNFAYAYGPGPAPPPQMVMVQAPQMRTPMAPQPVMLQPAPPRMPALQPRPRSGPQSQSRSGPQSQLRNGLTQDEGRMVERPLYELGVGLAFGLAPAYPASEDTMFNILPFPSIIYRGDVLRADREGARAVMLENDRFEFGLSLNASLPTDRSEIAARRGMPDLDFLVELGPSLRTTLYRTPSEQLRLDLPLRMVVGLGGDDWIGYRGLLLHPELKYRLFHLLGSNANAQFNLGPLFSLDGMGDYFYKVDAKYATASRPAFAAEEGYLGSELGASLSLPLDERIRLFTASRLMLHQGAANEASPLFKQETTLSFMLGLTYSFYHSDETVQVRE